MILFRAGVVLLCVSLSSTVRVLQGPPLNCSQQGLRCDVITSNCMDKGWLVSHRFTPTGPVELQVSVDTRQDEAGHLNAVLVAKWKLRDEGSISWLNATELHVLMTSTNQNLCVRYSFKDVLTMKNPLNEKWSFSADMVVLDPGQKYHVSLFNIPKPELYHSSYDVSADVTVPDCQDPKMKMTQFCIERGSLWHPNISVTQTTVVRGRSELAVSFSPDRLCDEYIVVVSCSTTQLSTRTYKANQTTLNVTFNLDNWPRYCCNFAVEIKPLFKQCGQDCVRQRKIRDICPVTPPPPPEMFPYTYTSAACGVVLLCVVAAVTICVICRKPGNKKVPEELGVTIAQQQKPEQHPTVLVIYSQDHPLYRDIVLKLCAFLRAKCGTKVLVDLLDSTSVGMVGRVRWLEWQKQQLKNPSDKILVLCSRGVQAKWRAMCGQGQVTLREDLLSPTDDMLTPFLNLFLPDMHRAGMLGKYMVAYFDDISGEQDVPSVFDIAVKYKLMKHFEELYFRIADIEKYQPGQVKHIKGIGGEEYFNCPSGKALKDAIEAFQAYQLENPDWFEKQCVNSEEEVMTEDSLLTEQIPPVLECVPLIKHGLPVYIHKVEVAEYGDSVHVLTPEVNLDHQLSAVVEITPVNHEWKYDYPSNLDPVLTGDLLPQSPNSESVYVVEPVLIEPPSLRQDWLSPEKEPLGQIPTEDNEEDSLLPMSQLSTHSHLCSSALQSTLDPSSAQPSCAPMQGEYFPPSKISHFPSVELEQHEDLESSGKGPSSGSDQGYMSKMSSQHELPVKEDPLVALARLQEELFQQCLR